MAKQHALSWMEQNVVTTLTKRADRTQHETPAKKVTNRIHVPGFDQICDGTLQSKDFSIRTKQVVEVTTFSSKTSDTTAITKHIITSTPPSTTVQASLQMESKIKRHEIFDSDSKSPRQQSAFTALYSKSPTTRVSHQPVMVSVTTLRKEAVPSDKIPDPPALPMLVWWFIVGLLCLGVLLIVRIYFIVFPPRWQFRDWLSTRILRRRTTATGPGVKKNDDRGRGLGHCECSLLLEMIYTTIFDQLCTAEVTN
jgi:hypothetical protein